MHDSIQIRSEAFGLYNVVLINIRFISIHKNFHSRIFHLLYIGSVILSLLSFYVILNLYYITFVYRSSKKFTRKLFYYSLKIFYLFAQLCWIHQFEFLYLDLMFSTKFLKIVTLNIFFFQRKISNVKYYKVRKHLIFISCVKWCSHNFSPSLY